MQQASYVNIDASNFTTLNSKDRISSETLGNKSDGVVLSNGYFAENPSQKFIGCFESEPAIK
jgi:hypothetical protein